MQYKIRGWHFIKYLGNLTFSILLLLAISFVSIIGTIIEQDRSLQYYQNKYPLNSHKILNINWKLIEFWKLNHLYTSKIFLTLLFIFGLSLMICTFSTQLPSLKNARQWKLKRNIAVQKQLYSQTYKFFGSFSSVLYYLNDREYYIFYQRNYIYGHKGLQGKLAPIFVHLSILLLMIGSITSLFTAFSIQEMIPSGEMFNIQNVVSSGSFSNIPNHINGTVQKFDIDYYSDKSIKQFYSLVTIKDYKNHNIKTQRISVNYPMYFQGLTIYQTDWRINGMRIEINDYEYIQIPLKKFTNSSQSYWFTNIHSTQNNSYIFLISDINGLIKCYNNQGQLLHILEVQQRNIIDHIPVKVMNILISTGLQVKQDIGISIVYLSFLFLMLTIATSYLSYSQIWLTIDNSIINISGATNRAEINFEEEIYQFKKFLA